MRSASNDVGAAVLASIYKGERWAVNTFNEMLPFALAAKLSKMPLILEKSIAFCMGYVMSSLQKSSAKNRHKIKDLSVKDVLIERRKG